MTATEIKVLLQGLLVLDPPSQSGLFSRQGSLPRLELRGRQGNRALLQAVHAGCRKGGMAASEVAFMAAVGHGQ